MDDVYKKFGRILVYHRKIKGLTQYEVADLAGMAQPTYALFELGKRRIPLSDIMKLSDVLGFDVNEVMNNLKEDSTPSFNCFSEFDNVEFSPEEITEISNYINYIISKRG